MRVIASMMVFLLCGVALAAEKSGLPSQYVQEQEYFSGHWVGEGNIGDDAVKVEYRARWAPGKHCLVFQGTTRREGKPAKPVHWTLLSGWDVAAKQIVDCFFDSDGDWGMTRWTIKSANEQEGNESGVQDGKKYAAKPKVTKHGPNAWTFSSTTPDGKPVKVDYKRVKKPAK